MTQVYENGISKDYDQLAQVICTLQEKIDSAGSVLQVKNTEKLKELNVLVKQAKESIEHTIRVITNSLKDLLNFSYHLRKHDVENRFTRKLLENRVKPDILVDIITSN